MNVFTQILIDELTKSPVRKLLEEKYRYCYEGKLLINTKTRSVKQYDIQMDIMLYLLHCGPQKFRKKDYNHTPLCSKNFGLQEYFLKQILCVIVYHADLDYIVLWLRGDVLGITCSDRINRNYLYEHIIHNTLTEGPYIRNRVYKWNADQYKEEVSKMISVTPKNDVAILLINQFLNYIDWDFLATIKQQDKLS